MGSQGIKGPKAKEKVDTVPNSKQDLYSAAPSMGWWVVRSSIPNKPWLLRGSIQVQHETLVAANNPAAKQPHQNVEAARLWGAHSGSGRAALSVLYGS